MEVEAGTKNPEDDEALELLNSGAGLLRVVEGLSFPRFPGTPGSAEAARVCADGLRAAGAVPLVEKFRFPSYFYDVFVRLPTFLLGAWLFALGWQLAAVLPFPPLLAKFVAYFGLAPCSLLVASFVVSRDPAWYLPSNAESANVWARVPPGGEEESSEGGAAPVVVVSAHHDSKSQRLRMGSRQVALKLSFRGALVAGSFWATSLIASLASLPTVAALERCLAGLALAASSTGLVALGLNASGNESPGAIDDATGVAVVQALAERFARAPPTNYKAWFVLFGAEEVGRMGSRAFVKSKWGTKKGGGYAHEPFVLNLNFDVLYRRLQVVRSEGLRQKPLAPTLLKALSSALSRLDALSSPRPPFSEPPEYLDAFLGNFTDRVPFTRRGFEGLDFTDWSGAAVCHSQEDLSTAVDPAFLAATCALACLTLRELDGLLADPKKATR
ncbi:MAG: hypothetical protein Kow0069_12030 [Promethearchaeota archaeon]